jgi:hypothetical protein
MAIMRVMQPSFHQVIDVIPMGHGFMSAARSVRVRAPGVGRAALGVGVAHLDDMFINMILMRMMQMTVMEVIEMVMMAHSCVSTIRAVLMRMVRMLFVAEGHGFARLSWKLVWCPGHSTGT